MYKTEEGRAILKLQEGDTHHGGCRNAEVTTNGRCIKKST